MSEKRNRDKPLFMISVAAKLTGMHPQTLRIYERKQLVQPGRTPKSTRLYSERDIERLKYIQQLTQDEGVNLAGAKIIIGLKVRLEELEKQTAKLENEIAMAEERLADELERHALRGRSELVLVPKPKYLMRR